MDHKIRVLVVDDSAFMRSAIKGMLMSDPQIEVVGTARDGSETISKVKNLKPDLVTMDIEMPRMDGLTAVKMLMREHPVPILVVSSLTSEGAQVTLEAMEAGAMDYISKDLGSHSLNIMNIQTDLIERVKLITERKLTIRPVQEKDQSAPFISSIPATSHMAGNVLAVVLGVSTGGPKALQSVIPFFPKDFSVPIIIVQHMPQTFTKCFAERLNSSSHIFVKEAETGDILKPGMAVVAKGGCHLRLIRKKLEIEIELSDEPKESLHRPSVNETMVSAVQAYGGRLLGVIMTGMGNDGCIGMHAIKEAGGKTIVQDEKSCVVYGMPKAIVDDGIADKVVSLNDLAPEIINMV